MIPRSLTALSKALFPPHHLAASSLPCGPLTPPPTIYPSLRPWDSLSVSYFSIFRPFLGVRGILPWDHSSGTGQHHTHNTPGRRRFKVVRFIIIITVLSYLNDMHYRGYGVFQESGDVFVA